MARRDRTPDSPQEELIESLPQAMQVQLHNGVVDLKNLTPEQLRDMTRAGAADAGIGDLSWASRGDSKNAPLDHRSVLMEEVTVPDVPNKNPHGRGSREL
jgi:hypothetical protein